MRRTAVRLVLFALLVLALLATFFPAPAPESGDSVSSQQGTSAQGLPAEAFITLDLILRGGPFPYRQDGTTFHNREQLLPDRPRGYYREFTVTTPGAQNRGARRIVTGGDPPEVFYYTRDHYQSFTRFEPPR